MHPSRRSVLAAGALGLASACTTSEAPVPHAVSADELRRREAAIREQALLQLYDAALAAFPALAPVLTPLREDHVQHRRALGGAALPTATASPGLIGKTAADARRRIQALERETATQHAAAALAAGRGLAPLLASLSACESAHVAVL